MPILPAVTDTPLLLQRGSRLEDPHRNTGFSLRLFFPSRFDGLPDYVQSFQQFMDTNPYTKDVPTLLISKTLSNDLETSGGTLIPFEVDFRPPEISTEVRSTRRANRMVNYAGWAQYTSATMTLNNFIDSPIHTFFQAWASSCGGVVLPKALRHRDLANFMPEDMEVMSSATTYPIGAKAYKANAVVDKWGPNGTIVGRWVLTGVWPSRIQVDDWNNAGMGESIKTRVDFSVDSAYGLL